MAQYRWVVSLKPEKLDYLHRLSAVYSIESINLRRIAGVFIHQAVDDIRVTGFHGVGCGCFNV
jgi:hypothetical protein